jgi:hypothetical protein
MTPRRSTRLSSPFSATRVATKKSSSGVSTPLRTNSAQASAEDSPLKHTDEVRYVLNVSPKSLVSSSAARSARKTPSSTVGRRRRGGAQAEEQPEESQSPSLRVKSTASEEEVDPENLVPSNENENTAMQSARKRGRPRKNEAINDVLTSHVTSTHIN